jgi:ElaB/YqjD/DUF883 family membrane-anchored ribosome-binding protein
MGEDPSQGRTAVGNEQPSPEELRRDIEQTREDLGETAAALASKTDVKARAKEKVEHLKQTAADKAPSFGSSSAASTSSTPSFVLQARTKAQENPAATAAGVAFLGGFLLGRLRSR